MANADFLLTVSQVTDHYHLIKFELLTQSIMQLTAALGFRPACPSGLISAQAKPLQRGRILSELPDTSYYSTLFSQCQSDAKNKVLYIFFRRTEALFRAAARKKLRSVYLRSSYVIFFIVTFLMKISAGKCSLRIFSFISISLFLHCPMRYLC